MNNASTDEVEDIITLDHSEILEYQKNRFPYLMLDRATAVCPGVSADGYKNLSNSDWFFQCHFPGDPNMPGMLQAEAMVQLAALAILTLPGNKGKVMYLTQLSKLQLKRKVVPGDRLEMTTSIDSWKRGLARCTAEGRVEGELACKATFSIVLPDEIEKFRVGTSE